MDLPFPPIATAVCRWSEQTSCSLSQSSSSLSSSSSAVSLWDERTSAACNRPRSPTDCKDDWGKRHLKASNAGRRVSHGGKSLQGALSFPPCPPCDTFPDSRWRSPLPRCHFLNCSTSVRGTNSDVASRVAGNAHSRKGHSNNRLGNTLARKKPEQGSVWANRNGRRLRLPPWVEQATR
jgi:hypothetical protein